MAHTGTAPHAPTREVPYDQQTVNARNPVVRYVHRHRIELSVGQAVRALPAQGTLLDYGCGPGAFLTAVRAVRPDVELVGYDPYAPDAGGGIRLVADVDEVADHSVDLVSVLETCEHLDDTELAELLRQVKRVLVPTGALLVSVPIIGGPVLVAKELNHLVLHRRTDYTAAELAAAALTGRPAARPADIKGTHKGFDFQRLLRQLGEEMRCETAWYSPFPSMPWGLNSQSFSLWRLPPA